jgi:signal transduction histidine kinase
VIIIDEQYRVTYMNPSAEVITGWNVSEGNRSSIFDICVLKDSVTEELQVNPFQCVLHLGKVNTLLPDLVLLSKSGEERPIGEGSMSPIINERGKFIGLVMIFKDLSDKIAHARLLKEFEKKHMAALLEGQEQERSRIAKDLHDGLGQTLNAIKINLKLLGQKNEKIESLSQLIDEAIQESVRISENLLPAKLKDFDLATCLKSLCNGIDRTSPIPVSFESLGNVGYIEQPQKINFYRIAQEAINNAIKHAQASSISVQLSEEEDKLQLMIEDDGKGFEKNISYDQSQHHGLVNMRERAEIMGGKLTIESDMERGTLIIVEAPLKQKKISYAQA